VLPVNQNNTWGRKVAMPSITMSRFGGRLSGSSSSGISDEIAERRGTCGIAFVPQLHQHDISLYESLIRNPFTNRGRISKLSRCPRISVIPENEELVETDAVLLIELHIECVFGRDNVIRKSEYQRGDQCGAPSERPTAARNGGALCKFIV
jgi:hypothetical protein